MLVAQIEVGMMLRLKRFRAEEYGSTSLFVHVTGIKAHPCYKTPWILSGNDAYSPSDFEREANPNEQENSL
jgi:hypothetical protein